MRLKNFLKVCNNCPLSKYRKNVVFGDGTVGAQIMFIAEAPGSREDDTGLTFQGASGQLFEKMLLAMKLTRRDVFVTNVVRCHPPNNRNPEEAEIASCYGYLQAQIAIVNPEVIVTFGLVAAQTILEMESSLGSIRKKVHYKNGIPVIATYHPSFLLRNPSQKREVWKDLQMVMKILGRETCSDEN